MSEAIYLFPLLHDLPNGLNIEMFQGKNLLLTPGCNFTALDTGDEYKLMFFHRDFEGGQVRSGDIITVVCKKVVI